jgi:hypothetical protein
LRIVITLRSFVSRKNIARRFLWAHWFRSALTPKKNA